MQKARLSAHRLRRHAHLLGQLPNDVRFSVFTTEGGPIRQLYVVADGWDKTTVGKFSPLAHFHATPDAMLMQEKIWQPELFGCSLTPLEVKDACRHLLSDNPSHNRSTERLFA